MNDDDNIGPKTARACAIAAGREVLRGDEIAIEITGSRRDLSARGRGDEFHRMVLRNGAWVYVADLPLPPCDGRAATRHAHRCGSVYPGEIVASHARGGPVDVVYLVRESSAGKPLVRLTWARRRDGMLAVSLPTGEQVVVSDPRRSS